MIQPADSKDRIQHAYQLYEEGSFEASLALCDGWKDYASLILAAENLLELGRLSDAEAAFCDLIQSLPTSSQLHFGLAEVLRRGGNPGAASEYAEAIRLDPSNIRALRRYAETLVSQGDHRAAIPVQKELARRSGEKDDLSFLMQSLIAIGEGKEATDLYRRSAFAGVHTTTWVEALIQSRCFTEAAGAAEEAWRDTGDIAFLRLWLSALARIDPGEAERLYRHYIPDYPDTKLLFSAALLAKRCGNTTYAEDLIRQIRQAEDDPVYHLVLCGLLAAGGDYTGADREYRQLLEAELLRFEDLDSLVMVIGTYIDFLCSHMDIDAAIQEIKPLLDPHPSWVSLVPLAELFEKAGEQAVARDTFYRAYRSDSVFGGVPYAAYLARAGEMREAEKVMLYILSHIQNTANLEMAAEQIIQGREKLYRSRKIIAGLKERLIQQADSLSAGGREILSVACLYAAADALAEGDYRACKEDCLRGLDVLPCYPSSIAIEDFLPLLARAKESAYSEELVIRLESGSSSADLKTRSVTDILSLTEKEKLVLSFLREHRETSEMELRTFLGSRRVGGIINEIIRKSRDAGITVIEKRGTGEKGEIYGYVRDEQ
ncbi:MAG: hypothetical protein D5R99_08970 [Methanocalculus sp. MSAO_Arc1]|uniref:tetratricopeptide repeat protein n=1 Tax=Methanocalculus TaxID=71151 RepID=UPI000FED1F7D|nr:MULTISPECIES: hypothetical protein [unclassified Methanocalculus]MCP1662173.1 tetratricopeptide (TPR) repeat protein [Methanocalculus sp. AMF5]RQD79097.1 MAG: hypothetical protein D5R99_08970 [Methanocalculus sp. MSAO_Arc1]